MIFALAVTFFDPSNVSVSGDGKLTANELPLPLRERVGGGAGNSDRMRSACVTVLACKPVRALQGRGRLQEPHAQNFFSHLFFAISVNGQFCVYGFYDRPLTLALSREGRGDLVNFYGANELTAADALPNCAAGSLPNMLDHELH